MSGKKLVVVVDDEPGFGETLQDVFEDEGYEVRVATDGGEALAVLKAVPVPPCIVILDLNLPVLDGNAVYLAMRADPALAKIAVVVITSDPAKAPSGVLLMRKPVDLEILIRTVRRCCDDAVSAAG